MTRAAQAWRAGQRSTCLRSCLPSPARTCSARGGVSGGAALFKTKEPPTPALPATRFARGGREYNITSSGNAGSLPPYCSPRVSSAEGSMSPLSILLNLLWIVFGGLEMAIGWLIAALIMAITIIGIPWARAAFNIAGYTLLPFGQRAVSRSEHLGQHDVGTGPLGFIGNII